MSIGKYYDALFRHYTDEWVFLKMAPTTLQLARGRQEAERSQVGGGEHIGHRWKNKWHCGKIPTVESVTLRIQVIEGLVKTRVLHWQKTFKSSCSHFFHFNNSSVLIDTYTILLLCELCSFHDKKNTIRILPHISPTKKGCYIHILFKHFRY